MKNNSLTIIKALAVLLVIISFLSSCKSSHGCGGICTNHGKKQGKYTSIAKNSKIRF
jgi:hypothetical protein